MSGARFVHTNIVAQDWRKLVAFYVEVFGGEIVPPERNLSGKWLDDLTGIDGARIQGAHVALPGYGKDGPTLEIFSYSPELERAGVPGINRQGLGHIAFLVDDVEATVEKVRSAGGGVLGSIVRQRYEQLGTLTAAYCNDPEGNFVEVQKWSR